MKKGENKNFVRNLYLIASIVLAAVLIFTVGVVVARFTTGGTSPENVVEAGNFYFTSDLLKEGGAEIALNPGTTKVSFELRNSADELRFADVDVNYTVSAEGGATLDVTEGTLAKDATSTKDLRTAARTPSPRWVTPVPDRSRASQRPSPPPSRSARRPPPLISGSGPTTITSN